MQKTETSGGKKGSDLPALKKALSSYLANEPQKTFPNLVGALKSKGIIDPQGLITGATNKRKVAYLIKAFPFMGSRELCLLTESPKDFVENYVFVPCDGETSLVYYLRSEGILNRDFQVKPELQWGCDTTQLLGRFSDENDYSFLEKMPKDIIESDWKSFNERPTAFEELTEYMEFS